ncbi:endo-1,4-beta-xylanase [Pedobacter psychroterrae]|uniref:Beta-xylanase n=1 Tax=Pedobacter psychroterrae TaxID=2530453 RepID=A0A4R0NNK5_9SPHI|nr:endo-1,4-beta-xylanase [Pedobacter psychroterrae]TCD01548.1 hypothetical protein EZ437_12510 [Pedobacter psychroterrae]
MKRITITVAFLTLMVFINCYGQKDLPLRNDLASLKPIEILQRDALKAYKFNDGNREKQASFFTSRNDENNVPVFTAEVFSATQSHYSIQSSWNNSTEIKKGDVLLARLAIRSIYARQESGDAVLNFYMQQSNPPYDKSVTIELSISPEWKTVEIPFKAANDMKPGEAAICISYGALSQKVEITNLQVLNFEKKITLDKLPTTKFTYAGREANAEWRKKALKRIEEIRTAPLIIEVQDKKGKPVSGAAITARLVDPEFIFGTAATVNYMYKQDNQSEQYLDSLRTLFNAVTIDNNLKWPGWRDTKKREQTKIAMKWIEENKLRLRGHNLVWPGKKFTPDFYSRQKDFGPGFTDSIRNHIQEIVSFTKGKVYGWDVINEMMHETDYFKVMPRSQAVEWFKQAKSIDSQAQMFINEYSMLNSVVSPRNIEKYIALIEDLRTAGAPIDAIGVQGHVGRQPRDPARVISDLDMFTKLGLPVQITEFDVNTPDDELQADYTRDFLIACYSHPMVNGFTMWGFWESAHWKPDAAMYRKDWTPKPNAIVWKDFVLKEWRTVVTKVTTDDGKVREKGHFGRYEITVTKEGKSVRIPYKLTKTSLPVQVRL